MSNKPGHGMGMTGLYVVWHGTGAVLDGHDMFKCGTVLDGHSMVLDGQERAWHTKSNFNSKKKY